MSSKVHEAENTESRSYGGPRQGGESPGAGVWLHAGPGTRARGTQGLSKEGTPGPLPTRNGPLQAASLGLGGLAEPHGLGGAQQGWAESRPGSLMVTRPRSTARGCREGPRQEDRCTWTRPAPPRPHLPHQAALGR